ncbi:MAG TPA: FtsW/RodA/SpoVE family cell cycle protein [Actinomycetota bacterium]|nr:FtsW/RodA/SpoVE family cell cycle protein [Actinomycetota bacterium]
MSAAAVPEGVARRARNGLGLLLIAYLISLVAYGLVGLGQRGEVPGDLGPYALAIGAAFAAGWIAVRVLAPRADPVLFPTAAVLAGLGLALLYRLRPTVAGEQATWLILGVVTFIVVLLAIRDDRQLDGYTYTIGLAGLILLLLPIVPGLGFEENGARLWIRIAGYSFQPAEFGRILIVIFLASYLASRRELLAAGVGRFGFPRAKDLGPLLLAWGASLGVLFLERDMGASLLLFGVFVVMLWVATGRWSFLAIGAVLFAIGGWLGYTAFGHVQTRIDYWLHALEPDKVHDLGYGQLAQSWFALASGGIVGTGIGQGSPDLIPYVASDFIFSAIGEELGLLGTTVVLLLFLILIGRGLRVGVERQDSFGKLLAVGLTTVIALQTFVIVGGVTRLIPLTGLPLPLVSYGGTSRVATFIILALLVRLSAGRWDGVVWRRRKDAT